jgi:hypothetical protein
MASSFGRYTTRCIKPTAAVATGALSAAFFNTGSSTDNDKVEDKCSTVSSLPTSGLNLLRNISSISSSYSWISHSQFSLNKSNVTLCEAAADPAVKKTAPYKPSDPAEPVADNVGNDENNKTNKPKGGMFGEEEEEGLFHGLFPRRQLWRPHLEYPLWDSNWDGRQPPPVESDDKDESARLTAQRDRQIRKNGVTRHVIMIRHGQYDETFKVCQQFCQILLYITISCALTFNTQTTGR